MPPDNIELWPQNLNVFTAFFIVSGQWRQKPTGQPLALDYTAVKAGLDLAGLTLEPADFFKLKTIEQLVLTHLN